MPVQGERFGEIVRLKLDKQFGFIRGSDGDYFFHRRALTGGVQFDELREGQRCTFTEEDSERGPRCATVTITE